MDGSAVMAEKTEEELRKEIDELQREQRQITERLRDPRGIRRGGGQLGGAGPRKRSFFRPGEKSELEDQPPAKRRLSSAVVKVEEGEIEGESYVANGVEKSGTAAVNGNNADMSRGVKYQPNRSRRDGDDIPPAEHVPRVLPKNEDPSLVNRNKRMLGQLLGTLERFRKEDMQRSGTEAYMRRSDSMKRAEEKAREESEKLRQQEREQIAEKRKRDLTLRARIAAKAEEKKLELLFLRWSEHQRKLGNFTRTKAEPPIYYMFTKPMEEDKTLLDQQKEQMFQEWKVARREELSQYQKQIAEQYVANVDREIERWQNGRKGKRGNTDDMANLQETMDKELETHQLEHGPKTRNIPGQGNNEDEDDVEDINAAEDDMIDDVLGVDEQRIVETVNVENRSPFEDTKEESSL